MQIYIPKLHITGATFDCGKYGSAELTPIERRGNLYELDIYVSPSYRTTREEAQHTKSIIEAVISERLNARTFEPNDTTNVESDIELMYLLADMEY